MASIVYTTDEDRADISFIHQNATNIKPKRDDIAHNPFAATGSDIMLIQQKGGQLLGVQNLRVDEINEIAERISLINAR